MMKKFKMFLEDKNQEDVKDNTDDNKGYFGNIDKDTVNNENYRKVLYTGNMQLVLMSLNPGEDIGLEIHEDGDQFFRVESGEGKLILNGEEFGFEKDFAFTIPSGKEHNIINTGKEDLKIYTIYSPPQHTEGTLDKNKSDNVEEDMNESIVDSDFETQVTEEEADQLFGEIDNEGYHDWFNGGYAEMFNDKIDDLKFKEFVYNDDEEGLEEYIKKIFNKYDIF